MIPKPPDDGGEKPNRPKQRLVKSNWRTAKNAPSSNDGNDVLEPYGKPISATQFIERLFGDLPELFKDEDELRRFGAIPKPAPP